MNFHYFASVFTTFLDGNVKLWNLLGIKESFKSLNFEKNEYMCFIQPRILKEIISHISLLVYALCILHTCVGGFININLVSTIKKNIFVDIILCSRYG